MKPFSDSSLNTVELFNECTFGICAMLCSGFYERLDEEAGMNVGWLFIGVCCVNIGTTVSKILSDIAAKVYAAIAKKCSKNSKDNKE